MTHFKGKKLYQAIQIVQLFETLQHVINCIHVPDSLVNWAEKRKTNLRMMEKEVPL